MYSPEQNDNLICLLCSNNKLMPPEITSPLNIIKKYS